MQASDETVYKNGTIYKRLAVELIMQSEKIEYKTELLDGSVISTYPADGAKQVFKFSSLKFSKDNEHQYTKTYNHTLILDDILGTTNGDDLSNYDLPDSGLVIATGSINGVITELYFAIESNADLINISDYYSLTFPLPFGEFIDSSWRSNMLKQFADQLGDNHRLINNLLICSIVVDGHTATGLKMYRFGGKHNVLS